MALMLDTERAEIPREDDGTPMFDTDLCDWGDGKGPKLTVNVPTFFETARGVYDSQGVVSVPLRDVLEEYLAVFEETDGGEHIDEFAAWLKEYAERLIARRVRIEGENNGQTE